MNSTTKTVAVFGAAFLAAVSLLAYGRTAARESITREQQREEYENTLRLWLATEPDEKSAACQALHRGADGAGSQGQPTNVDLRLFDEEFLEGRC